MREESSVIIRLVILFLGVVSICNVAGYLPTHLGTHCGCNYVCERKGKTAVRSENSALTEGVDHVLTWHHLASFGREGCSACNWNRAQQGYVLSWDRVCQLLLHPGLHC